MNRFPTLPAPPLLLTPSTVTASAVAALKSRKVKRTVPTVRAMAMPSMPMILDGKTHVDLAQIMGNVSAEEWLNAKANLAIRVRMTLGTTFPLSRIAYERTLPVARTVFTHSPGELAKDVAGHTMTRTSHSSRVDSDPSEPSEPAHANYVVDTASAQNEFIGAITMPFFV